MVIISFFVCISLIFNNYVMIFAQRMVYTYLLFENS